MTKAITKEFKIGEDTYVFQMPTIENVTEADVEYSKAYTRALQVGILPRIALERILIRSGAWTDEDEKELNAVVENTQTVVAKLSIVRDKEERAKLVSEYFELRIKLAEISGRKQSMLLNSAETKGEEAKITSLLVKCTKKNGALAWATKKDLLEDRDSINVGDLVGKFVSFMGQFDEKLAEIDKIVLGDSEPEIKEDEPLVSEQEPEKA